MLQLEQLLEPSKIKGLDTRQSIDAAVQRIFSSSQEESRLQQARRIMGDTIGTLADEDLEAYLTEFQYLLEAWFDAYEQQVFDGLTLKQLLGQG